VVMLLLMVIMMMGGCDEIKMFAAEPRLSVDSTALDSDAWC